MSRRPASITLAQAVPKGKNMDLIIQKATELGISSIVPLLSERTVIRIDPADLPKKQAKWQCKAKNISSRTETSCISASTFRLYALFLL